MTVSWTTRIVTPMPGATDLEEMLAHLTISRRPGTFVFATVDAAAIEAGTMLGDGIEALITEAEGTTIIATVEAARARGLTFDFEAAWLTLDVHSSLTAVGLTAAFAQALAAAGIPCNVLAGFHHDHLLVPVDDVDRALAALEHLRG